MYLRIITELPMTAAPLVSTLFSGCATYPGRSLSMAPAPLSSDVRA